MGADMNFLFSCIDYSIVVLSYEKKNAVFFLVCSVMFIIKLAGRLGVIQFTDPILTRWIIVTVFIDYIMPFFPVQICWS